MKKILGYLLLFLTLFFAGCGQVSKVPAGSFAVWFINNGETKMETHFCELKEVGTEEQIREVLQLLSAVPEDLECKAPLNMGFQVLDMQFADSTLMLNVDKAYKELPVTTEVLVRAALVRTFTQIKAVSYVMINVEGEQLYDNAGEPVGRMNGEQFILSDGNAIHTHELAKVRLYFAGESGSDLIAAYREKHYATNVSLERLVVEELIAGPGGQAEGLYPSVNPNTKIINIITKDGICYVNLDENFLMVVNNVSTDVSIYAVVNSLVELSNVTKVQVLVNGQVPPGYQSATFERNLDIVTTLEK